jgi:hypothetical protein
MRPEGRRCPARSEAASSGTLRTVIAATTIYVIIAIGRPEAGATSRHQRLADAFGAATDATTIFIVTIIVIAAAIYIIAEFPIMRPI